MRAALLALALIATPALTEEPRTLALFPTHFNDTSTEGAINGIREDETARLALFDEALAEAMEGAGYDLAVLDPVEAQMDRTANVANCNGCAVRMGRELGVSHVMTAEVQKVSNLILALNVALYDAETGELLRLGSADIRGNDDRSWLRGQRWLLKNRILKEDAE